MKNPMARAGSATVNLYQNGLPIVRLLLGISFFIPSAPFPPKARGRWGFDAAAGTFASPDGNAGPHYRVLPAKDLWETLGKLSREGKLTYPLDR